MSRVSRELGRRAKGIVSPPPMNDKPARPATGRAGRNLPWAFAIGIGLLALVGVSLVLAQPVFVGLVAVAACVGCWELARACGRADIHVSLPPLWMGTVGMVVCAWQLGTEATWMALFLTVGALGLWRLLDGGGLHALRDVLASTLLAMYVPFLASFVVLTYVHGGPWPIVTFVLGTVSNDIGGYATGVLFGKHKLAPSVSPSKSWEGLCGSVTMSMIVVTVCLWLLGAPVWVGPLLGAASALLATLGDLGESLIKRDVGLKDMGSLLPGHGGLMDRLDSLLVTAPLYYVVFSLVCGW